MPPGSLNTNDTMHNTAHKLHTIFHRKLRLRNTYILNKIPVKSPICYQEGPVFSWYFCADTLRFTHWSHGGIATGSRGPQGGTRSVWGRYEVGMTSQVVISRDLAKYTGFSLTKKCMKGPITTCNSEHEVKWSEIAAHVGHITGYYVHMSMKYERKRNISIRFFH